ncbi:MAG: HEAT repeat domain-containing protein, partial [Syntrophaceae bacterium]|nr:HEAT repeat domain-containing protein [Syntrophaceae bacterium]
WEERLIALTGLADLKDKRAIPVILEGAGTLEPSEPESEERLQAIKEALRKFGCMPSLINGLNNPDMKFRSKVVAIEVIGELQCAEAVPHLIKIMDGDLREVRRASVLALAAIRGDKALQELRKRIEDRDGHVRNAAITFLGRIGDKKSFPLILRHVDKENYPDVLEETIKALLKIDEKALFTQREKLSPAIRVLIARYAAGAEILLTLSQDQDVSVRVAALSSLGRFSDGNTRTRLVQALRDENAEARKVAVNALGSQNCCYDDITHSLRDSDMWVRLYAVKALGESRKPEAAASIIPLLYDKEVPVVLATIEALIQLGRGDAVALSALQSHPDEAVRERISQIAERAE